MRRGLAGLVVAVVVVEVVVRVEEMSSGRVHGFVQVAGRPSSSHDNS